MVFLFSSSHLLNPQPYGTQFHTTQLRFVGSASVPRRGRNFKEILRNNLRVCINIPTTNSSEWQIFRNLLTSLSFWAKRRIQLIFIGCQMIFYDIKKLFTFSFLFRRKKKKQNRKRKTRMIKWLESSGALPPNPLLYSSYWAKRSISSKNVVSLPLGGKGRMRGESVQAQQYHSPHPSSSRGEGEE